MSEWLQIFGKRKLPEFGVVGQNDEMAMGAKYALIAHARLQSGFSAESIPVVGVDGTAVFGQRLTRQNELTATVIVPPTAGRAVSEVAAMLLSGARRPEAEVVLAPASWPDVSALGCG